MWDLINFSYHIICSSGDGGSSSSISSISNSCSNSSSCSTWNSTEISHLLSPFHTQSYHVRSTIADYLVHILLLASEEH